MDLTTVINIVNKIISNPVILSILPIIITASITYYFTSRKFRSEKIRDINILSLENVYLPIFRKLENIDALKEEKCIVTKLYTFMLIKVERNYLYTNPTLYILLKDLKRELNNNRNYNDTLYRTRLHIKKEYQKLRRKLGYPGYNRLLIFRYLSNSEKIIWLIYGCFVSLIFSVYTYYIFANNNYFLPLSTLTLYWFVLSIIFLIIFIVIGIIYYILLKLKKLIYNYKKTRRL